MVVLAADAKHPLNAGFVRLVNVCRFSQTATALRSQFCIDMILVGALALNFSIGCELESLLGSAMGFHLRHDILLLITFRVALNRQWPRLLDRELARLPPKT